MHVEKRKGKTFVEGLKEEEYCSRNEEEKGCRFFKRETRPRNTASGAHSDVFQRRQQMLVCERGTTVPRRRSTTVQGVLQRREALNQSRPCSDGETSAGSTIQGQVCRQLGTTPIGEGSELLAGVDVTQRSVSEAGGEGVHDGGRQATGQGGFGQDGTTDNQAVLIGS